MLEIESLQELKDKKNLLAFSGGVDSTALFFLLLQHNIEFDIAIVDYNQREQSKEELCYAKELASTYNLACYSLSAEDITQNFEAKAREVRYNFFEKVIKEHNYTNLITAHHLGDRFEWMLMQFCKGAGCAEIAGMQRVQQRDSYRLIRPLLNLDKKELYQYLHEKNIKFFEDESNLDTEIKRNAFRHNHTTPLLDRYRDGIKKSFAYLESDKAELIEDVEIQSVDNFAYFKSSNRLRSDIFNIDKYLKSKNYMLSFKERELLKEQLTLIVGREFVIHRSKVYIFIAPYTHKNITMSHDFKERCRVLKIEPKLRSFFYTNREAFKVVEMLLTIT